MNPARQAILRRDETPDEIELECRDSDK